MSQVVFSMVKTVHFVMRSWFVAANVTMTNFCVSATNSNAKAPNSTAKPTNSIAKPTNSIANGPNSVAKATNSTANGTKSTAKPTSSTAKTYNIFTITLLSQPFLDHHVLIHIFHYGFLGCTLFCSLAILD